MRYVDFEAGDKVYNLRYDFNAIADLEQKAGSGVVSLFSEEKIGFNTIRVLLWAGLKSSTAGITIDDTGKIIGQYIKEGNTIESLSSKITEALNDSGLFGKGEEKSEAPFLAEALPEKSKNSKK